MTVNSKREITLWIYRFHQPQVHWLPLRAALAPPQLNRFSQPHVEAWMQKKNDNMGVQTGKSIFYNLYFSIKKKKKKNIARVFHQHSHSIPSLWLTGDKQSRNTRNTYVCKAALVAFMRFLSVIFSNINKALVSCPCGKQRKYVAYLEKWEIDPKLQEGNWQVNFYPPLCTVSVHKSSHTFKSWESWKLAGYFSRLFNHKSSSDCTRFYLNTESLESMMEELALSYHLMFWSGFHCKRTSVALRKKVNDNNSKQILNSKSEL